MARRGYAGRGGARCRQRQGQAVGRATAELLARHGADVIVHGRDAARSGAVAGAITAAGGTARFAAGDLNDPAQLDDLAGQAGSADVLVNNAGFSWIGPTADLDAATFDRLYTANVRAPYFLVAALAPAMAARGNGSIINIGSQSGQIGMAGRPSSARPASVSAPSSPDLPTPASGPTA
jgi:NAD(P)-dependent dehydrogenase (short-subunit alcohol dehydrogenase family)